MKKSLITLLTVLPSLALAAVLDFNTIPRPPFPGDPQELVTADAQAVTDAQQRIAAIGLLDKARALSNVRAQPYSLKTSFTASGALTSDGVWALEDIAPRGGGY